MLLRMQGEHEIEGPKGSAERIANARLAAAAKGICFAHSVRNARTSRCSFERAEHRHKFRVGMQKLVKRAARIRTFPVINDASKA